VSRGTLEPAAAKDSTDASGVVLLRPAVGYPRAVGRRVASYLVNQDGNTVKLRPRLVRSKHGSRPELLVPEVRHVRLAISCCYEDPVLVNQHYGSRFKSVPARRARASMSQFYAFPAHATSVSQGRSNPRRRRPADSLDVARIVRPRSYRPRRADR
jgi:hypothetical protein